MKLKQNARELVLIDIAGAGLLLGEVRYNKQTETVFFALEKSAFFDLYFPCTVNFDPQRGPVVHPHVINAMTTSSIRVQRERVNFFVLAQDIAPSVKAQYMDIIRQIMGFQQDSPKERKVEARDEARPRQKIVELIKLKKTKEDNSKKK